MTLALQHLARAQASGALAELAAAGQLPPWLWQVVAVAAAAVLALFAGGQRRARNPRPKHLGAKLARIDAMIAMLRKREKRLNQTLDRYDRVSDHYYKRQKRELRHGLIRIEESIHFAGLTRARIIAEAEAAYDAERSWRPIMKNPHAGRERRAA